jgi:hypothetical protein
MLTPLAYGGAENLPTSLVDKELGFLRMAPLLAAGVAALFFCGRSLGLSGASTTLTSNWVPPSRRFFWPSRGNSGIVLSISGSVAKFR